MAISTIGTNGIENGAIVAADIASGAVTQSTIANGVAGTGPAFRAQSLSTQNLSVTVSTKFTTNGEIFDTANCYDPTTNYRFTPNVAGYYQVNASGYAQTVTSSYGLQIFIFKNGSQAGVGSTGSANSVNYGYAQVSTLLYLNGTTDYIECYGNAFGSGTIACSCTEFSASLVRAA